MPHDSCPPRPTAPQKCLDCGAYARHQDTCPQRTDLLDLLDADLARLAVSPDRVFTRPLHRVEVAMLEAATAYRPSRRDQRRCTVHVEPWAPGGVRRTIRDGDQLVAEVVDEPAGAK